MKKARRTVIVSWTVLFLAIIGVVLWVYYAPSSPPPPREVVELQLTEQASPTMSVSAVALPEFTLDLSDQKFSEFLNATGNKLKELTEVTLVHQAQAVNLPVEATIHVDKENKKLLVSPPNSTAFKPGRYKLSVKLRTLEGEVDIDQDFTWGVIAVNTNKSIYQPGETAKLGFGILNDSGETQCAGGYDNAQVWVTITSPDGEKAQLSTEDGTIKDSGECGSVTVTNKADFQATYKTGTPGIYTMDVTATIRNGEKRSLKDYFKVDDSVMYDIERHDFPTRIYPGSAYPVAFRVNAKKSYKGQISDVLPRSFEAASINNGGRIVEDGAFKKIVWDVDMSANKDYFYSYIIRFPMISPEFYLLGPITIGDFKEARQWQIASDAVNSTSGLAAWEDNGGSNTWSRVWTGTTWSPALSGAATAMAAVPADSRWFREVSSPKTGEKLVAILDNVGPDDMYMYRWNGSSWTQDFKIDLAAGALATADETRGFDVAYEEESGDALFVYSDYQNAQLLYRKRSGGVWDGASSSAGDAYDVYKRWVRLKPQFNSDTILVGFINNNERVGAMIWDGSSNTFTNQLPDNAGTLATSSDEEAMDIAIETQSGTPMIFWGTTANSIIYREFSSGSWQAETNLYTTGFTNDVEWVTAASDPVSTSNYIALAFQESDGDTVEEVTACEFGVWDGSAPVTRPTEVTCRSDYDGRLNTVAFENTGSRAMWVYGISTSGVTGQQLAWRTWTNGGGFTSNTTEAGASGNLESIQLYSDLNTTTMMAIYADSTGTIFDREWDGTSWSAKTVRALHTNGSSNLQIQNTGESAEAYGFGFDRNLETLGAYRFFTNANNTTAGAALTSQDTPYTLTSANEIFRLRILLYYPDSLPISGRTYKLQYVDPGSGTCIAPSGGTPSGWTDVSTSGSDPISFYNNASPADGANLSSNGSDPTYSPYTKVNQTYEEQNTFTNSASAMTGDQVGLWDFSLIDNTIYDRNASAFCFRVARSNDLVLQTPIYPQINTAAVADVLIQGGSRILGGTLLQ